MVNCLRGVEAQVLTNQELSAAALPLLADPFPPILDGIFAVQNPGPAGIEDKYAITPEILKKCWLICF